jgi:hypothetical protein
MNGWYSHQRKILNTWLKNKSKARIQYKCAKYKEILFVAQKK